MAIIATRAATMHPVMSSFFIGCGCTLCQTRRRCNQPATRQRPGSAQYVTIRARMASTVSTIVHTLSQALRERVARAFRAATRRERTLRIGVDIRPFYEPLTGIGWYLYHLLHEIAKRDDVELLLFGDARITDIGPRLHADLPPNAQLCWFDLRGRGIISRAE